MKIISIKALRDFWTTHPDAEQPLKAWHDEVQQAEWKTLFVKFIGTHHEYDVVDADNVERG
ncbi:hypothetical protein [Phytobacter diazotrophicus]|uniref:hypothetical protein n=1 Tax=Phytobacter diazotrophicus TaxID=395631 RepID=UPI0014520670|nr:hypothetical protein [Phytobacter diazotrophicus]QJF17674.1 hypothetical protein HHA33_14510 [Phytobacter diazotrophicus]